MNRLILGILLGAAAAYWLDPDKGRRRQALLRDRFVHYRVKGRKLLDKQSRNLKHHVEGAVAEARRVVRHDEIPDQLLIERVRAAIGRETSHADLIEVAAQDGHVILSGHVLDREIDPLVSAARRVAGVRHVDNHLQRHRQPEELFRQQGSDLH